jgi:hypothetical protein
MRACGDGVTLAGSARRLSGTNAAFDCAWLRRLTWKKNGARNHAIWFATMAQQRRNNGAPKPQHAGAPTAGQRKFAVPREHHVFHLLKRSSHEIP